MRSLVGRAEPGGDSVTHLHGHDAEARYVKAYDEAPAKDALSRAKVLVETLVHRVRKRGNPNWGRPVPPAWTMATEFELQVKVLGLTPETCASSRELRMWCHQNKNRVYIPEWLLKEWRITVDDLFTGAA